MSDGTPIEWTDATWNPVTGCSVTSPGCTNCYAMKLAGTRLQHHWSRKGLTRDTKAGPVWTGKVRFNEEWLTQPLAWRRPRRIFVCAHGDLFHEDVPDAWIDKVFAVIAMAPQHQFQVLTKRAKRMREYMQAFEQRPEQFGRALASAVQHADLPRHTGIAAIDEMLWPLPNVWLGVSVEDQVRADERVPDLLNTPAAVRWISAEPLLGPVDLSRICLVPQVPGSIRAGIHLDALAGRYVESGVAYIGDWDIDGPHPESEWPRSIDWVVAGGESGHDARPMHPDWVRALRDQCAAAGTAFLFKQWGEWRTAFPAPSETPGRFALMARDSGGWTHTTAVMTDRYPRQFNAFGSVILECVGKKKAGRLLDGIEHNGFPDA